MTLIKYLVLSLLLHLASQLLCSCLKVLHVSFKVKLKSEFEVLLLSKKKCFPSLSHCQNQRFLLLYPYVFGKNKSKVRLLRPHSEEIGFLLSGQNYLSLYFSIIKNKSRVNNKFLMLSKRQDMKTK